MSDFPQVEKDRTRAMVDSEIEAARSYRPPPRGPAQQEASIPAWPELQPLIARIDPQEYPLDALPDAVRCAVQEVAGFVKAPIPLIATSALAALSLAIQAHVDVQRADKLHGPCGLFLLAIADSGERKTTCDSFFTSDNAGQVGEVASVLAPTTAGVHDNEL